jgi:hypothetical protein
VIMVIDGKELRDIRFLCSEHGRAVKCMLRCAIRKLHQPLEFINIRFFVPELSLAIRSTRNQESSIFHDVSSSYAGSFSTSMRDPWSASSQVASSQVATRVPMSRARPDGVERIRDMIMFPSSFPRFFL